MNNLYDENVINLNWQTCLSSNTLCTEHPFNGPCTQKDANNPKLGVTCNLPGCILGTYYNETTETCLNCPHGKFGHTMNAFLPENQSCTNCPYGRYNNQSGLTECNGCPRGRYGIQLGAISLTNGCQNCAAGTFGNATGAENKTIGCTECPFGTYEENVGSTKCTSCSGGRYGVLLGAERHTGSGCGA